MDWIVGFVVTWTVILTPPAVVRAIYRKPLEKWPAIWWAGGLYFVNFIVFAAMGGQSKSHLAVLVGAYFSYLVLRWQTNKSARKQTAEQRAALGYADEH
jgi:hypothetical protein